jgi:hypothetical protein
MTSEDIESKGKKKQANITNCDKVACCPTDACKASSKNLTTPMVYSEQEH